MSSALTEILPPEEVDVPEDESELADKAIPMTKTTAAAMPRGIHFLYPFGDVWGALMEGSSDTFVPHSLQKFSFGSSPAPQFGHLFTEAPQAVQNMAPSSNGAPHLGHFLSITVSSFVPLSS